MQRFFTCSREKVTRKETEKETFWGTKNGLRNKDSNAVIKRRANSEKSTKHCAHMCTKKGLGEKQTVTFSSISVQ